MMKKILYGFIVACLCVHAKKYDVSVVGYMVQADGIGRLSINFMEMLKEEVRINFIPTRPSSPQDLSVALISIANNPDKTPGSVAILFDILANRYGTAYRAMPDSRIKLAYSMTESSLIPSEWVQIFNTLFDGVVVPDETLVEVYTNSGVTIPVFALAIPLVELHTFLEQPIQMKRHTPFTFGVSAGFFSPHKNHLMLVETFAKAYGNNTDVWLRIHGRRGDDALAQQVRDKIKELGLFNVEFIYENFSQQQYLTFMKSLDAYVLLSKGEGFSITPRESLALGIPTMITNNSAHKVICNSGFVRGIPSLIAEPAYYQSFGKVVGNWYNCTIPDVVAAFQDIYTNYAFHKEQAIKGREWVKRYTPEALKPYYRTLVKPKKVVLGSKNVIYHDHIETRSQKLYDKYKSIKK